MKNSVKSFFADDINKLESEMNTWLHSHTSVTVKSIEYQRDAHRHYALLWYEE